MRSGTASHTSCVACSFAELDELQACTYRAWIHHGALVALALWFVAEVKLDWAASHPRDPQLRDALKGDVLPALSTANLCELLTAVLPLHQMTPREAILVVVRKLVGRAAAGRGAARNLTLSRTTHVSSVPTTLHHKQVYRRTSVENQCKETLKANVGNALLLAADKPHQ